MRPDLEHLEPWRISHPLWGRGIGRCGCFVIDRRGSLPDVVPIGLKMISSDGGGWEHVSVSLPTRCPTWDEMCWVKDQFWRPAEVVMQLHVEPDKHVNIHPFCLHLWRPRSGTVIPRPPRDFV